MFDTGIYIYNVEEIKYRVITLPEVLRHHPLEGGVTSEGGQEGWTILSHQ